MQNGLNCAEAAERLHDYIDEALPPMLRQGLDLHLRRCDRCRRALIELRCTRRLLRSLPRASMPDAMKAELISALRHSRHTPPPNVLPTKLDRPVSLPVERDGA